MNLAAVPDSSFMIRNKLSSPSNQGRYVWVGLAIAIAAAAAVGVTSYKSISQYYSWVDWVTHTRKVLAALDQARGESFGSVAALQSYFQTGERRYLDQLAAGISDLKANSAALRALTLDNPSNSAMSTKSTRPSGAWRRSCPRLSG